MAGALLNPTLWRTCRILAGATRVRMLRLVMASPGLTVTEMAGRLRIGLSRASQELRRLNSRGLLAATRAGSEVRYRLSPDPQVADAGVLTAAIRAGLRASGVAPDAAFLRIASCFTHPRRLAIVRELLKGPRAVAVLRHGTGIPLRALKRHLVLMCTRGIVGRKDGVYWLRPVRHPLFRAIMSRPGISGIPPRP
jgi:DNA-binding transcriptional ArsR family regulator